MEKTLAKRQAQLRETERSLKECKADLQDAKEQVNDWFFVVDIVVSNLVSIILLWKNVSSLISFSVSLSSQFFIV